MNRSFALKLSLLICFLLSAMLCPGQNRNPDITKLKMTWEVVENNFQGHSQFLSAFTLTNKASRPLPATGWTLYFNFVRDIKPETATSNVSIAHINGDLYSIKPAVDFVSLDPGHTLRIEFVSSDWAVNFTDAPSGLYIVWDDKPDTGLRITDYMIIPSTEPKQYLRSPDDKIGIISPADIFEKNRNTIDIEESNLAKVFPSPVAYEEGSGLFMITENTVIEADPGFEREADYLSDEIYWVIGKRLSRNSKKNEGRDRIHLTRSNTKAEAYTLSVNPARIQLSASTPAGIFYGIQSLKSLINPSQLKRVPRFLALPSVEIMDGPRFGHRAFFLDVSRNFQSKDQLLKIIDLMALYKLNVLHLHLNDDEGWRLEIPGLPELTEIGSKRGHTLDNKQNLQPSFGSGPDINNPYGSGFYSRSEYIEILKYAKNRFVKIIPEIETPGHARAAVKAMEARYDQLMKAGKREEASKYLLTHPEDKSSYKSVQGWNDNIMDPGLPSTYIFLEKVVDEIIAMYKEADAPLETIHFGGDEVPSGVWEQSPASRELIDRESSLRDTNDLWYFFFQKIDALVKSKGLYLYGWEEIAMRKTLLDGSPHYLPNPDFTGSGFQVDVWNNVLGWGAEDLAYRLANGGYKVVLSCVSHLYFDMAYSKAFDEPGYYWGAYVDIDKPFDFIPYDYFKNASEDRLGNALNRNLFIGKERLTDYGKQNIVGIQGLIWSENMIGPERLEYQMLPKLLGLAERAWAKDPEWAMEKDSVKAKQLHDLAWSSFASVVGKRELPRLDYYHGGYAYRIPSPGAIVADGKVHANIQLPGFTIRYTTDGREPTEKSKIYQEPIATKGTVKLKAFNSVGRGGRTVSVTNP